MITLPIYYTQEFKTKKDKTFLVSLNWYRNAHYFIKNEVKKHFHSLVEEQSDNLPIINDSYTLHIDLYYKNTSCDGHNICNMMEKFTLDALQELGNVKQDSVKFHIGTSWTVVEQDKQTPRCDITIIPIKET